MELIDIIHKTLPQIQCGRCETPGCYQYANDIANGAPHDRCVPGGAETLDKLNIILNYVNPIGYKIIPWKNKPKTNNYSNKIIKNKIIEDFMIVEMGKNIDCYDLCRTSNNFYTKVFGVKIVFQNPETKNTIIVNGIITELLISCFNNDFLTKRKHDCIKNKPSDDEFQTDVFDKFIKHLTIKEWLIYNNKDSQLFYLKYL